MAAARERGEEEQASEWDDPSSRLVSEVDARCGSRGSPRQRTYKRSNESWLLSKLVGSDVPKRLFDGVLAAKSKDCSDNMMVYIYDRRG